MRRDIDAAVFFRGRQSEHVVILVDGPADRAQRIVAVGQDIGQREALHSGSSGRLNNTYKCNIVGSHGVKSDPELVHGAVLVMVLQNRISDGSLRRLPGVDLFTLEFTGSGCLSLRNDRSPADKVNTAVI